LSLPEMADAFFPSCLLLGKHIELRAASRLDQPVSDPFGSAFLALHCCFSLLAFRRRNYFSVSPFGGSFGIWALLIK
jgi:hypothetical protein